MNIDLWHNIGLKGELAKKDIYAHHFTDFSHQDLRKGPLASIMSMERVCVMILNKTSFISASQRILLGIRYLSTLKIMFTAAMDMA